ncbi:hypothetical protein HYW18_03485 [Candidatus Uhrbacteria bacterium]|nr:hypothetical protein [Candidatus Uhrbacteria bacterium]
MLYHCNAVYNGRDFSRNTGEISVMTLPAGEYGVPIVVDPTQFHHLVGDTREDVNSILQRVLECLPITGRSLGMCARVPLDPGAVDRTRHSVHVSILREDTKFVLKFVRFAGPLPLF